MLLGGWGFPEDPVRLQCPVQIMTPCHLLKPASETPLYCGDKKQGGWGGGLGACRSAASDHDSNSGTSAELLLGGHMRWLGIPRPALGCVQLNLWSWWDEEVCLTHKSQQQQTLLRRYWEVCREVGQREAGPGRAGWPSPKPRLRSGGATVAPPVRLFFVYSLFEV